MYNTIKMLILYYTLSNGMSFSHEFFSKNAMFTCIEDKLPLKYN